METKTNFDVWKENLTPETFADFAKYLPCYHCPAINTCNTPYCSRCRVEFLNWASVAVAKLEEAIPEAVITNFDVWKAGLTPEFTADLISYFPCRFCPACDKISPASCPRHGLNKCKSCFLLWAKGKGEEVADNDS